MTELMPNHRVNRTAEQLRCWVPASLRAAAAGYASRSALAVVERAHLTAT